MHHISLFEWCTRSFQPGRVRQQWKYYLYRDISTSWEGKTSASTMSETRIVARRLCDVISFSDLFFRGYQ